MIDRGNAVGTAATSEPLSPGPLLFARYAFPPNELGYCGPPNPNALLESAANGVDLERLSSLATRFTGAWPYLELIACCNGITDPLDTRVVEAYWVGNALLEQVPLAALSSLRDRFADHGSLKVGPEPSPMSAAGTCHHSFHVFAVYPWLGILRSGKGGPALTVLDRCRIRWGRVEAVDGDQVTVRNRVLDVEGPRLVLGPEQLETARRSVDGVGLAPEVAVNDVVSLHWDWVCDRLSPEGLASLSRYTAANLTAVNALLA
jgi:hypothetical protein